VRFLPALETWTLNIMKRDELAPGPRGAKSRDREGAPPSGADALFSALYTSREDVA